MSRIQLLFSAFPAVYCASVTLPLGVVVTVRQGSLHSAAPSSHCAAPQLPLLAAISLRATVRTCMRLSGSTCGEHPWSISEALCCGPPLSPFQPRAPLWVLKQWCLHFLQNCLLTCSLGCLRFTSAFAQTLAIRWAFLDILLKFQPHFHSYSMSISFLCCVFSLTYNTFF